MANVYRMIIDEFERRQAYHYDLFPPFFICSVACHFFNILNEQRHFWTQAGEDVNTRLNILFVAPLGQEKSFWIRQFLRGENSILEGVGNVIPVSTHQFLTEAAYVGTRRFGDKGQVIPHEGIIEEKDKFIIGFEEVSDLFKGAKEKNYNIGFNDALLTSLDNGDVSKKVAAGEIRFKTHLTMWAGTQPARMDLESGMDRRFLFLFNAPTKQSMKELTDKYFEGTNVELDTSNLFEIQKAIRDKCNQLSTNLNKITFSKGFRDFLKSLDLASYDIKIYEKIALGYNIMVAHDIGNELNITLDNELRRLILLEHAWRKKIKEGPEISVVFSYIESTGGDLDLDLCRDALLKLGFNYDNSTENLKNLIKSKKIKIENDRIFLVKKPNLEFKIEDINDKFGEELEQEIIE